MVRIAVINNNNVSNEILIQMFLEEQDNRVIASLLNKMIERKIAKIVN